MHISGIHQSVLNVLKNTWPCIAHARRRATAVQVLVATLAAEMQAAAMQAVATRCNTGCATHLSCLLIFFGNFSEGLSEAQNGYIFCMLLGQVALTGTFQAQLCYVISNYSNYSNYSLQSLRLSTKTNNSYAALLTKKGLQGGKTI